MVVERADGYLAKAEECLAGAESEHANARYNNCANRCYYACFQAAIVALRDASIQSRTGDWSHSFVQSQFVGQLVNRRKVYPAGLRQTLARNLELRHRADYETTAVSSIQAERALQRSRAMLNPVHMKVDANER